MTSAGLPFSDAVQAGVLEQSNVSHSLTHSLTQIVTRMSPPTSANTTDSDDNGQDDHQHGSQPRNKDDHNGLSNSVQPKHGNSRTDSTMFFDSDSEDEVLGGEFSENREVYWCHCGKDFTSSFAFYKHKTDCCVYDNYIGVCTAQEYYSCKFCNYITSLKYNFNRHISSCRQVNEAEARSAVSNEGQQSQIVKDIGESHTSSENNNGNKGKKRKRSRESDYPFECPIVGCVMRYKKKGFYDKHMRKKHPNYEQPVTVYSDHDHEGDDDEVDQEYFVDANSGDESRGVICQYLTDEEINLEERAAYAIKLLELTIGICDGEEKNRLAIRLANICENFF